MLRHFAKQIEMWSKYGPNGQHSLKKQTTFIDYMRLKAPADWEDRRRSEQWRAIRTFAVFVAEILGVFLLSVRFGGSLMDFEKARIGPDRSLILRAFFQA